VIFSIVLILALLAIVYLLRKRMPIVSWGMLFFFLMLLPVSNFLFAAGFLKAERILYIPSIGVIIVMAALLITWAESNKGKIPAMVLTSLLVLFFTGKTITRAAEWKNNYTLSIATLKTSPDSPRFNNMMGLELKARKQGKEAMAYFEKAVQSNPNHVPALVNLGLAYRNAGRYQEAADILEKALDLNPGTLATYVNLMSVYRSLNDNDKNLKVAKKALARYPESAPIVWNAANAYQLMGDMPKANELRARALAIDPGIGGQK
jgi:tetratricopeptide (TPR) repeat protein